jgi:hypothetical protein
MATIAANLSKSDQRTTTVAPRRHALKRRLVVLATAVTTLAASCLLAGPAARADTRGFANLRADFLAGVFGANPPFSFGTPPTAVDLRGATYSGILNDYIGMTVGLSGSFSQRVDPDNTVAYTVPGRISFGNIKGSIRDEVLGQDDNRGLPVPRTSERYPSRRYGPSPRATTRLPTDAMFPAIPASVLTARAACLGKGASKPPASSTTGWKTITFRRRTCPVNQFVRLYRSTAEITYVITNNDAAVHTVGLQFTLFPSSDAGTAGSGGIRYFVDPSRGVTERPALYQGADIPDSISFADQRANPIYFSRFTFRGFRATQPDRVFVTNAGYYATPAL